jgi:hypothetical protein
MPPDMATEVFQLGEVLVGCSSDIYPTRDETMWDGEEDHEAAIILWVVLCVQPLSPHASRTSERRQGRGVAE